MKNERKRILYYTLFDVIIFIVLFFGTILTLSLEIFPVNMDSSFYGLTLAFSIATFTISAFVCTMNYTGQNKLMEVLIKEKGYFFTNRWTLIFTFEIISSLLQIFSFIIHGYSKYIAIAIALGGLALCVAQAVRSIRLLIAIMHIAEENQKKEERDSTIQDINHKHSKHMLENLKEDQ